MIYQPNKLDAIQELGYSQREAEFLYIAATHSGYFLQRQFDLFAAREAHTSGAFARKATLKQIIRPETFARGAKLYNIYSRRIYNALGIPNSRNRRSRIHSLATIKTKLLLLEFILLNPQHSYLETEQQRLEYFTQVRKIDQALLPATTYRSKDGKTSTIRYFVDRFPIFLPADGDENTPPTFTYIDDITSSVQSFKTHLDQYLPLLRALKRFHFIFVSTNPLKFDLAEKYFFARANAPLTEGQMSVAHARTGLVRYFVLREQWENPTRRRALTQNQILFLSTSKRIYTQPQYEALYDEWKLTKHLPLSEPDSPSNLFSFSCYLVEQKFDLFGTL